MSTNALLPDSLLRPDEALISIEHVPPLPALLATAPRWILDSERVPEESRDVVYPWLRRTAAQWLGVYLEATASAATGSCCFEWQGETLVIHHCLPAGGRTTRKILPDDDGRYLLRTLTWRAIETSAVARMAEQNTAALTTLAGTANPCDDLAMVTYFGGFGAGAEARQDALRNVISRRSRATPLDPPFRINGKPLPYWLTTASRWDLGWCRTDGFQPTVHLETWFSDKTGYQSTVNHDWATCSGLSRHHVGRPWVGQLTISTVRAAGPFDPDRLMTAHAEAVEELRRRYTSGDVEIRELFEPDWVYRTRRRTALARRGHPRRPDWPEAQPSC